MTKKYNMTESDKIQVRIWTPTWKADRAQEEFACVSKHDNEAESSLQ